MEIISLLCLAVVVSIAAKFSKNAGIVAVLFAYVFGIFAVGMKAKDIYAGGWPDNIIFTTLGVCLLFGVANINGTTEKMAKSVVFFARGNRKILPIAFFIFDAILAGSGGGTPLCALLLPLAMTVGVQNSIPPMVMALMSMGGLMVGGLSPLSLNGIVAGGLAAEMGIPYGPIWLAFSIGMTVFSFAAYFLLGGWKLPKDESAAASMEQFDTKQILTMVAILAVLVGALFFKQEISLLAFGLGAILLLFGFAEEKAVIRSMPWNTVLMIAGMSILINVVTTAGGIDWLSEKVSAVMNGITVYPAMTLCGALLGAVSSGTGVAMPTLIPAAGAIAEQMGMNPAGLVCTVIVGINSVVISPLSTIGAMCLSGTPETVDKQKMYNHLLLSAGIITLMNIVLAFVGFYRLFG